MQSLFGFHETLKVDINGVPEISKNVNDAQRVVKKETKKKDCKDAFYIQPAVDATNFDLISHVESVKESWDILVKYYKGCEKVKVFKL